MRFPVVARGGRAERDVQREDLKPRKLLGNEIRKTESGFQTRLVGIPGGPQARKRELEIRNPHDVLREYSDLLGPTTRLWGIGGFLSSEGAGFELKHAELGDRERTGSITSTTDEERDVEHLARHDCVLNGDFHRSVPEAVEVGKTAKEFVAVYSPLWSIQSASFFSVFGFASQKNDLAVTIGKQS